MAGIKPERPTIHKSSGCPLWVISGRTIAGQNLAITLSANTIQKVGRFVRQPIQIDPVPNF
jgi:hypothetical protein